MNVGDHLYRYVRKITKMKILGIRLTNRGFEIDKEVEEAEYQLRTEFEKQQKKKRKEDES